MERRADAAGGASKPQVGGSDVVADPIFVIMYAFLAKAHIPIAATTLMLLMVSGWIIQVQILAAQISFQRSPRSLAQRRHVKSFHGHACDALRVHGRVHESGGVSLSCMGIGLVALPMDNILAFIYRPKPIKPLTLSSRSRVSRSVRRRSRRQARCSRRAQDKDPKEKKATSREDQKSSTGSQSSSCLNATGKNSSCAASQSTLRTHPANTLMPWFQLFFAIFAIIFSGCSTFAYSRATAWAAVRQAT